MRKRSHWAWGYEDRFPNDDARRELATRVAMLLQIEAPQLKALPSLDNARVSESRFDGRNVNFLDCERETRIRHAYGRGYPDVLRGYQGDFLAAPDAVAFPGNDDEVLEVLRWAGSEGVKIVPYGGGTSVVGGVERDSNRAPFVSLSLRKMNRLLDVDVLSRSALFEGGALGPEIEQALSPRNLTLRHFPQSFEFSTLGGWIATRAGGHFATVYTHIEDLVQSLRMVTPSGIFETKRLPASGAGPSADRFVAGSEGTLGVITRAWMRVFERPSWRGSTSVHFATLREGAEAVRAIAQSQLHPHNCRLLDPYEALINNVPSEGGAVLLLGFESSGASRRAALEEALALALAKGGRSPRGIKEKASGERGGDASTETWRQAFLDGPYLQSALVTLGVIADTFETACTWSELDELLTTVRARVESAMKDVAGKGILTCRFTHVYPDGPAPYFTFIMQARPGHELEQWLTVKQAASEALVACGATITHHHAVGRVHLPWFEREASPLFLRALQAAKDELDPHAVLNPGVLLPKR